MLTAIISSGRDFLGKDMYVGSFLKGKLSHLFLKLRRLALICIQIVSFG